MTLNNGEMIAETQMTFLLPKLPIRYDEGVMVKIVLSFYGGNFTL